MLIRACMLNTLNMVNLPVDNSESVIFHAVATILQRHMHINTIVQR